MGQADVLTALEETGDWMTIAELSKATDIGESTICANVRKLINQGLATEHQFKIKKHTDKWKKGYIRKIKYLDTSLAQNG